MDDGSISSPWCRGSRDGQSGKCKASIRVSSCWSIWGRQGQQQYRILQLRQPSCRRGKQHECHRHRQPAWPRCTAGHVRRKQARQEVQQSKLISFVDLLLYQINLVINNLYYYILAQKLSLSKNNEHDIQERWVIWRGVIY